MKEAPQIKLSYGETEHVLKHHDLAHLDKLATEYIRNIGKSAVEDTEFMRQVNEILQPIKDVLQKSTEFRTFDKRVAKTLVPINDVATKPTVSGGFLLDFDRRTVNADGQVVIAQPIYLDFFRKEPTAPIMSLDLARFAYSPAAHEYAVIKQVIIHRIYFTEPNSTYVQSLETPGFWATPIDGQPRTLSGNFGFEQGQIYLSADTERWTANLEWKLSDGYNLIGLDLALKVLG